DIYFFKKGDFCNRKCNLYSIPNKFFKKTEQINFIGQTFNIPQKPKRLLKYIYGSSWNKPIKGYHADIDTRYIKLISILKKVFPYRVFLIAKKIYRFIKPIK